MPKIKQRPSQSELGQWRTEPLTKWVLYILEERAQDVVDDIVNGSYQNYAAVERARGIIQGLRMMESITRGED